MKRLLAMMAAVGMAAAPMSASAIDWTIGAGASVGPDYEGSDDYEAVPLWNVRADGLYHEKTYAQIFGPKLNSNLVPHDNCRAGLSAEYIFKRKDVDDDRVDDMSNTDDGFLVGALLGYDFNLENERAIWLEFDPRWDVNDDIGGLFSARAN